MPTNEQPILPGDTYDECTSASRAARWMSLVLFAGLWLAAFRLLLGAA